MKTGTGSTISCIYVTAQPLLVVASCPPFHQASFNPSHFPLFSNQTGPPNLPVVTRSNRCR